MTIDEKVDELRQDMQTVKTALTYDGTGLIPNFEKHCESDKCFREDYYKFKRRVIGIFCFLAGSGVLGITVTKIIQML